MRHLKKKKKLGREKAARKSLYISLASSLFLHEKIKTTGTKAKAVIPFVDKAISLSKAGNQRELIMKGFTKNVVAKLIEEIGKWYPKKNSGYTRIIPLYYRKGDNAKIVQLSLTEKDAGVAEESKENPKNKEIKKIKEDKQAKKIVVKPKKNNKK